MTWKTKLRRELHGFNASRVPGVSDLSKLAKTVGLPEGEPRSQARTMERFVNELEQEGSLVKVRRALWLNQLCEPRATLAEAAQYLRPGSVVSLDMVLGDAGVLNNYTYEVSAIIPIVKNKPNLHLGREQFGNHIFRFHGIPQDILDRIDPEDAFDMYPYPRATIEAALTHWTYLAKSPHSTITRRPLDIDPESLDLDRLNRTATAMNVICEVDEWISRAKEYNSELDNSSQTGDPGYAF